MCQLLVYVDVNLFWDNVGTIKENTQAVVDDYKEVGLEVNALKTKYKLICSHKNAGQNRNIKIAEGPPESVAELRYLCSTSTN
jgi:hypothetical protein